MELINLADECRCYFEVSRQVYTTDLNVIRVSGVSTYLMLVIVTVYSRHNKDIATISVYMDRIFTQESGNIHSFNILHIITCLCDECEALLW